MASHPVWLLQAKGMRVSEYVDTPHLPERYKFSFSRIGLWVSGLVEFRAPALPGLIVVDRSEAELRQIKVEQLLVPLDR